MSPAEALSKAKPYLPWASLAVGIASALLMERKPERAYLVVLAAIGAWILLAASAIIGSLDAERMPRVHQRAVRWGLTSTVMASQSLVQLCLFFALPFYVRAASWSFGQVLFIALLIITVASASWDPAYRWVFEHRWVSLGALALTSFAGLACVLPVLGLGNRASLLSAAVLTSVGAPVLERLRRQRVTRDWRLWLKEASVVLCMPAFATVGASAIPPAPLSMPQAAIGTELKSRWVPNPLQVVPRSAPQVVCATAIRAPRGLKDQLRHEWRHDGQLVDTIPLSVSGGRQAGFRTWSKKRNLGADPDGKWSCRVVTEAGQLVGEVSFVVRGGA